MENWINWARGPLFVAAMVVLIAGLLRVVVLNIVSLLAMHRRSRQYGRSVPWKQVALSSLTAMLPLRPGSRSRGLFSLISVVFHVGIIITPIFLAAHIRLWNRGLGLDLSWPSLSAAAADWLSVMVVVSALLLFVMRVGSREARALSRAQDYLLPLLIAVPFASGLLAMHPALSPFSYQAMMLVHVLAGDLILILIPLSKISHVVLFPASQLVSELGWHLQPGAGQKVAVALGKEDEPI